VRPRRVAGDTERPNPQCLELRSPVTQELQLVRSRPGPVEEEEEQQDRPVLDDLLDRVLLARADPDGRMRDPVAGLEHQPPFTRTTSRWSYVVPVRTPPWWAMVSVTLGTRRRPLTLPVARSGAYR